MPVTDFSDRLDVVLDESARDDLRLVAVGALVLPHDWGTLEASLENLLAEVRDMTYLDQTTAMTNFERDGFHATSDDADIAGALIRFIGAIPGAKIFIEYSDRSLRPDLTPTQMHALLFLRISETILMKYKKIRHVNFIFEQNQQLDRRFPNIVSTARQRTRFPGEVSTRVAPKGDPQLLAITDYALYYFARMYGRTTKMWEKNHWKALLPLISHLRCLDTGDTLVRSGAPVAGFGDFSL